MLKKYLKNKHLKQINSKNSKILICKFEILNMKHFLLEKKKIIKQYISVLLQINILTSQSSLLLAFKTLLERLFFYIKKIKKIHLLFLSFFRDHYCMA